MKVGRSIELFEDGRVHINSFVRVAIARVHNPGYDWRSDDRSAAVESIEADQMLETCITELGAQVQTGLEYFAQRIGSSGS
jgi:hypothetical protein